MIIIFLYSSYFILAFPVIANASFKNYPAVHRRESYDNVHFQSFQKNKVILKVYYESLCPASVDFFTNQLQPTVEALGSRMTVILVPYGNAETNTYRGSYSFACQHGPQECYGNKLHACAIDIIKNNTKAVFYNSCLMKYSQRSDNAGVDFTTALNWCGYKYKVPIRRVWKCAHSKRGAILLRRYGQQTYNLNIKYVPYVLLDNSSDMQDQATAYLMATICQRLEFPPSVCEVNRYRKTYRIFA